MHRLVLRHHNLEDAFYYVSVDLQTFMLVLTKTANVLFGTSLLDCAELAIKDRLAQHTREHKQQIV